MQIDGKGETVNARVRVTVIVTYKNIVIEGISMQISLIPMWNLLLIPFFSSDSIIKVECLCLMLNFDDRKTELLVWEEFFVLRDRKHLFFSSIFTNWNKKIKLNWIYRGWWWKKVVQWPEHQFNKLQKYKLIRDLTTKKS